MIFPYDKGERLRLEIERLFRVRLGSELFDLLEKIVKEKKKKNHLTKRSLQDNIEVLRSYESESS